MMMLMRIKQHLSNIWSSLHKKVKQHWGWVEQSIAYKKKRVAILEKWKSVVHNKSNFGAVLSDLPKALDCLPHDLLLAKLNTYGFSLLALKLVQSYLSNRKQRTKINSEFSSWEEILFGLPQRSILGPLWFNIFLYDLFFIMNDKEFAS